MKKKSFNDKFTNICKISSQLIHQKGFSDTTMRDISRATGMSLGGLYHYFENKEDLLFKILNNYMDLILSNLEKELSTIDTPHGQITFILRRHIDLYIEHYYESKCLLHEREYLRGRPLALIKQKERKYYDICKKVIKRLCREAGCTFIHPNVLTFSFFALVNWIYQWYDPKGPISPPDLARQLAKFFIQGVSGKKL